MSMLVALAASVSEAPTSTFLPTPYLPETWMKVAYLVTLYVVIPIWISVHAWVRLHQIRHDIPPYLVLRLHQWWHGKPRRRFLGMRKASQ